MPLRVFVPALLGIVLSLPTPALAWHRDGHMAIARMAWKQLEPGQQLQIAKLQKAHPHYETYLCEGRPKDLVSEAEWAFMRSAVWSDWVRDPSGPGLDSAMRKEIRKQFNKPVWHYVDLPFIHPRDVDRFDAAAIRKTILEPAYDANGEPRHALSALEQSMKTLQTAGVSDVDRAVALCWLMHVVGDLHQPLHGTSLIASKETYDPPLDPPGGDLGGNRVAIKVRAGDVRAMNLHFYWDSLVFRDEPGFAGMEGIVAKLLSDPKMRRGQFPELKARGFLAWAEESLELCKTVVYKGKDGMLEVRTLPAGSKTDLSGLDAPVLPEGYRETAEKIAARRMVLAAYRLADQLQLVCKASR